jgi:hypothetical protein
VTTLDPQILQEIARNIVLDHAKDIDYIGIGEMLADFDKFSSLPEDEFEHVQGRVDKMIRNAVVTVTWPDDQAQTEQCPSRVHRDFANGQDIRCELPAGHAPHRNGEREWMP